jgi:methoxymalonate biosynthesis acyl carrier protein
VSSINVVTESGIKETIRHFISNSINITQLGDDDDLFESGIANSLFAVQLMTFVEKTFAIEVGMDDLEIENFKSLNATAAFVVRKNGRRVVN